jgi:KDO2-lipid IV(A) lauroyltransferase
MLVIRLFSYLPFWVLYGISDFLFFVSYRLVGYRRKMVLKNLKNSFPEKSEKELRKIEKQFYKSLCDYAVEMLKLFTISKEQLLKRVKFNNTEVVFNYLEKNQSMIYVTSHQFNWEWGLVAACLIYPAKMDFVYQAVNSKFFNDFSLQSRTRFGAHAIKRDEVARELVKRKGILRGTSIMADQYPGYGHDKKYFTTFLNQETVLFYGANQIATLTQQPVIYHEIRKVKRGYYEVFAWEIATPPYEKQTNDIVENYVRAVEKSIRLNPPNWLWSHNRWKKRHLEQQQQA